MQRNYTNKDVKRYRDENSCSLYEAKAVMERNHLLATVHVAHKNKDFDLLCDVVRELIHHVRF